MRTRNTNTVKTTTRSVRAIILTIALSFFIGIGVYLYLNVGVSKNAYAAHRAQSQIEGQGNWDEVSTWKDGDSSKNLTDYIIDGTVTKTGNLSLSDGQSLTINPSDTLIVTRNLDLADNAVLSIKRNAVLIVRGDYNTHKGTEDVVRGGTLIILGKLSFIGEGANIVYETGSYIYYDRTLNAPSLTETNITGRGTIKEISTIPTDLLELTYGREIPVSAANELSVANPGY